MTDTKEPPRPRRRKATTPAKDSVPAAEKSAARSRKAPEKGAAAGAPAAKRGAKRPGSAEAKPRAPRKVRRAGATPTDAATATDAAASPAPPRAPLPSTERLSEDSPATGAPPDLRVPRQPLPLTERLSNDAPPTEAPRAPDEPEPAQAAAGEAPAAAAAGGEGGGQGFSRDEIVLEFEQRPPLEPPVVPAPLREPGRPGAPRRLAFVLHAHLPWVIGHGTWPHGEDWLAEAVVHCYLPLLDAFRRLAERGRRDFVTLSVTPILAAMFADARTPGIVDRYLAERTAAAWEARRRHPLALWWHGEFERLRALWEGFDKDLIRALDDLSARGAIELSTSAATHVYLPLAHTSKLARLALRVGRESHRERFGVDPRGCWLPECAYRPGGEWRHPATGASEPDRPGNEELLAEQGLDWTVLDAHLLRSGDPAFPYLSDLPPEEVVEPGGPHPRPFLIRRSGVAAFLRDARTAAQVWSRQGGYPGDGAFLDFHKRHWPSGLRFWRVTGPEADLIDKLVYWPDDALRRAREQAEHFVALVSSLDRMDGGLVCAPFDAELFGHWWFEGPAWLERVLELAAPATPVEATTPARELDHGPALRRAFFGEGSWGAGGDHRVWVNPETDWFWRELRECEREAFAAVRRGGPRKWRRAILNQLLLAAASDWPFLVTMGTGRDYAEKRFRGHVERLRELVALGPRTRQVPDWTEGDLPFPDLEPEWSLPPEE